VTSPQGVGVPLAFQDGGLLTAQANQYPGIGTLEATLTTANVPQVLGVGPARNFIIITNISASDTIYIGSNTSQFISLTPGQSLFLDINQTILNTNYIYFVGPNAGDAVGVTFS